jgi:hypothetical protein
MEGWIAVDLDGTLAEYHGWEGVENIGAPIAPMIERVKAWLSEGRDVRIFTARVDGGATALAMGNELGEKFRDVDRARSFIEQWCEKYIGQRLPVTNVKDYGMIQLWDDRAVQIETNTGKILGRE